MIWIRSIPYRTGHLITWSAVVRECGEVCVVQPCTAGKSLSVGSLQSLKSCHFLFTLLCACGKVWILSAYWSCRYVSSTDGGKGSETLCPDELTLSSSSCLAYYSNRKVTNITPLCPCFRIRIVKTPSFPKQSRDSMKPHQNSNTVPQEKWKESLKIYMDPQNTRETPQNNLQRQNHCWRYYHTWCQVILWSYGNKHIVVLAQKQTQWSAR